MPTARTADTGATITAMMDVAMTGVIMAIVTIMLVVIIIMTAVVSLQMVVGPPEGALHSRFQPWTAQTCLRYRV